VKLDVRTVEDDITVVRPSGDMDLYNSGQLRTRIQSLWAEGRRKIVLDLSDLRYIDSSGIGVLLYVYTSSQRRGAHIFFSGVHGSVLKSITLTKLNGFLPIVSSASGAVDELRQLRVETSDRDAIRSIRINENDPLLDDSGMYSKTFNIDFGQIRRLSALIAQQAPPEIQEVNILEQQISEIIKNAVKHGNNGHKEKPVRVSFSFSPIHAHVIVEDSGHGFLQLEEWNEFYRKKIECYQRQDFDEMMDYLSFRTSASDEDDGGNALFAAVEFWNAGVVFNEKRNKIAVRRTFI